MFTIVRQMHFVATAARQDSNLSLIAPIYSASLQSGLRMAISFSSSCRSRSSRLASQRHAHRLGVEHDGRRGFTSLHWRYTRGFLHQRFGAAVLLHEREPL
jgi:hypothetical protein